MLIVYALIIILVIIFLFYRKREYLDECAELHEAWQSNSDLIRRFAILQTNAAWNDLAANTKKLSDLIRKRKLIDVSNSLDNHVKFIRYISSELRNAGSNLRGSIIGWYANAEDLARNLGVDPNLMNEYIGSIYNEMDAVIHNRPDNTEYVLMKQNADRIAKSICALSAPNAWRERDIAILNLSQVYANNAGDQAIEEMWKQLKGIEMAIAESATGNKITELFAQNRMLLNDIIRLRKSGNSLERQTLIQKWIDNELALDSGRSEQAIIDIINKVMNS